MRCTINIYFTDESFVFLGAYSLGAALTLLDHVLTSEVTSISIKINEND